MTFYNYLVDDKTGNVIKKEETTMNSGSTDGISYRKGHRRRKRRTKVDIAK